jgi:hypothetical protein
LLALMNQRMHQKEVTLTFVSPLVVVFLDI